MDFQHVFNEIARGFGFGLFLKVGPWSWGTHLDTIPHTMILVTCSPLRLWKTQNALTVCKFCTPFVTCSHREITSISYGSPINLTSHDHEWRRTHDVIMTSFALIFTEITQKAVKSRKMVQFWWCKRLGPLKKGCPTAWKSHLADRTVANAPFWAQTPLSSIAVATDTLNSNLTWTPYHLLWVLVWSVQYPERRYASNKQIMANYIEM